MFPCFLLPTLSWFVFYYKCQLFWKRSISKLFCNISILFPQKNTCYRLCTLSHSSFKCDSALMSSYWFLTPSPYPKLRTYHHLMLTTCNFISFVTFYQTLNALDVESLLLYVWQWLWSFVFLKFRPGSLPNALFSKDDFNVWGYYISILDSPFSRKFFNAPWPRFPPF